MSQYEFQSSREFRAHFRIVIGCFVAVMMVGAFLIGLDAPKWLGTGLLVCATAVCLRMVRRSVVRTEDQLVTNLAPVADALNTDEPTGAPIHRATNHEAMCAELRALANMSHRLIDSRQTDVAKAHRLMAMLDAIGEPVIALDAAGTVTLSNQAAHTFLATSPSKPVRTLVGMRIEDVLTKADLLDIVSRASAGKTSERQIAFVRDNTTRYIHARAVPFSVRDTPEPTSSLPEKSPPTNPPRTGALITMRDVTPLASANQVKTDFVANASHELRTPIATIQSAAETLGSIDNLPAETRNRMVSVIQAHAGRLEEIVSDLLDLSRLESPQLRVTLGPFDLDEMQSRLRSMFDHRLGARSIALEFDIDPQLRHLRTDPTLLMLIMKNLVENAIKFAREGTTVRIVGRAVPSIGHTPHKRAASDTPTNPNLTIDTLLDDITPAPAAYKDGLTAVLEVIDKGVGIPFDQQQRIFERFYQVDGARTGATGDRGSGLGLAIVKHAVRTLGGRVHAESVWKQGTRMVVELPCALPPDQA